MTQRFVIVGGGLAGGSAASALREEGFRGEVSVIGAEPHPPYERPPLSKSFLRGETPFEDALVRPDGFWAGHEIEVRSATTVRSIDPGAKVVVLGGGERVPFERLLIATGARNRRVPIPGVELRGVFGLRTLEDAMAIRAAAVSGNRVAVCGMGFIGSEVAASVRSLGLEVVAIDSARHPLERVLGPEVGEVLAGIHRDHGVRILSRDRVAAFEGDGRLERVRTVGGAAVECDLAVVGMGVEPVTELAEGSGIAVDNGIVVDERCRTNVRGVYAAGDVANHWHPVFGRRMRIEHWQNARKQGWAAALNMLGRDAPYGEVHWFWSDQYEHNLQYAGFHTQWDDLVVRGSLQDRRFAAFYLQGGRVLAAVAVDRGRDVRRAIPLIASGRQVDPARLRDEDLDPANV